MRVPIRPLSFVLVALLAASLPVQGETVIRGVVRNAETGEGLFPATIRVGRSNTATVTNPEGRFEFAVEGLPAALTASHIGFRSATVTATTSEVTFDLSPVVYALDELVVTAEDPATSIVRKVIEKKQERLARLASLKAKAYTRLTLRRDTTIVSVIESVSDAFWRKDGGWREVLRAKRMTRNMDADAAMPAVAFMDNLYDDDVVVAGHTLVGVTHPDALDVYDFSLTGRRRFDDRTVYDIAVTPKNSRSSAFVGSIAVLDEAYALLDADLRPGESFRFPPPFRAFDIAFRQQFRPFGDDVWLPVDLHTTVRLKVGIPGLRFPPARSRQVTRISDYEVNAAVPDSLWERRRPLIDDAASRSAPDSLMETSGVVVPLTAEERSAMAAIDSTETLDRVFRPSGPLARLFGDDDGGRRARGVRFRADPRLWFNRVDEGFLGVRPSVTAMNRRLRVRGEVGYSTGIERWTVGSDVRARWKRRRYEASLGYRRGTMTRQDRDLYTRFSGSTGLFGGEDYYDYYWREEVRGSLQLRSRRLNLRVASGVRVETHRSLAKSTTFAIISDFVQRENPAVDEGRLRSLTLRATHGGEGGPPAVVGERKAMLFVEHSRPGLMDSDFDFTQVRAYLGWRFKTFFARRLMANTLDVTVVGSTSTGRLPIQRFGHIDASLERWHNPGTFRTLHANPYEGEHTLGLFWEHHFRTIPFELLGWDRLVDRSIGLIVFGGHGRTWIADDRLATLPFAPQYVDRFHHEAGVSISGLFDFLRVDFAKRLDTSGFTIGLAFAKLL